MLFKKSLSILFFCCCVSFAFAQNWTAKKGTLMTRFSKDVNPDKVLPEYPRPQMVRNEWLNLNGLWQYQPGIAENEKLPAGKLTKTILVPYPVESALSGVMEHHDRLWYKRTFNIPSNWRGRSVLLHFGAVDFESEVFINGKSIGIHKGGYDPFSYDITDQITKKGVQEIAVRVYDATDNAGNPRGKQSLPGGEIMYTSTSGIWQTVWLEPVAPTYINSIILTPDIDQSVLKLKINSNAGGNAMAMISVKDGSKIVATLSGKANEEIIIPIPNQKLWSPEHPFLYDITVSLKKGTKNVDKISGYFGMRKISVHEEGGFKKMFLNNKFVFQIGPLDQGFWPDGVYTAPTDEALRYDLEVIKKLGFNMVRKHIKVERMRWYYWADKLGVMVWQDMPSANSYSDKTPEVDTAEYSRELTRLVQTHINSPSIIMWVIFNESQGQNNTVKLVNMVHQLDASRLINQASGGGFFNVGDMLDIHSYPSPDYPKSETQAMACGEYGGIGYEIKNHVYKNGWGYQMVDNQKSYDSLYVQFAKDLTAYKTSKGLSAAVYTQLTDVETELNGLMTYDRAVIKGDISKIADANRELIKENLKMHSVLATSELTGRQWKYTTSIADSTSWSTMNFDDKSWAAGDAGFGTKSGRLEKIVRTVWDTNDIWLRQKFSLNGLSRSDLENLVFEVRHDGNVEIYLNGVIACKKEYNSKSYVISHINHAALQALNPEGENVIAIHCNKKRGDKFIDVGLTELTK